MQKIIDWFIPESTRNARAFIGLVIYYHIFIAGFAIIAVFIFILFRKNVKFVWIMNYQLAMNELKWWIIIVSMFTILDFSSLILNIILNIDASMLIEWDAILSQLQLDETIRSARFESGIWSKAEKKYDAVKLECRGLLKTLKKFRFWLFERHFFVEIDAQTLMWLLNQPSNDLSNTMIIRWLVYIRLFDFDVKYISDTKNDVADALSRHGQSSNDDAEDSDEIDDYFEAKLYSISISQQSLSLIAWVYLHKKKYENDDLILEHYLESLHRSDNLMNQ